MRGRWRGIRLRPLCTCRRRGGLGEGGREVGVEGVGRWRVCGLVNGFSMGLGMGRG